MSKKLEVDLLFIDNNNAYQNGSEGKYRDSVYCHREDITGAIIVATKNIDIPDINTGIVLVESLDGIITMFTPKAYLSILFK